MYVEATIRNCIFTQPIAYFCEKNIRLGLYIYIDLKRRNNTLSHFYPLYQVTLSYGLNDVFDCQYPGTTWWTRNEKPTRDIRYEEHQQAERMTKCDKNSDCEEDAEDGDTSIKGEYITGKNEAVTHC